MLAVLDTLNDSAKESDSSSDEETTLTFQELIPDSTSTDWIRLAVERPNR